MITMRIACFISFYL